jgi:hypothetical protein
VEEAAEREKQFYVLYATRFKSEPMLRDINMDFERLP